MGDVGLLLVGVVLFVNGLAALGVVPARSAAPLNFFVGTAQVVLPTLVLVQSGSDPAVLAATWPSYLFGITYLWYGFQIIHGIEPQGFGWYSSFVAAVAAFHAVTSVGSDPVFAVIWATWAIMWTLFFLLMGLGLTHVGTLELGRFTGWFLVWLGIPTCTVSALFLLEGRWSTSATAGWAALAGLAALTVLSVALARSDVARSVVTDGVHDGDSRHDGVSAHGASAHGDQAGRTESPASAGADAEEPALATTRR
ncbi:AmiS/UreI family transporter [Actinotalea sp. K2]|uniref:AmiS/UreI family transporter n=1 Tax=Actinotalea sp. K2 TaxID=2939438 RepID=UPI0020180EBA|nr:AmiS/UreI family transporter [Actinotalea sp. K2]MCL3861660.1 transporter [Actinotalea sp. K2]